MSDYELGLMDSFTRSLEKKDFERKRVAFEALRKYFFLNDVSKEMIDLVLLACIINDDIRRLGANIAQLASPDVHNAYRLKLIERAECGPLLYLVRITMVPFTRDEMVMLGHQIQALAPKVMMEDAMKIIVTARDTPEMTKMDCMRLERQLGYGPKHQKNGH